MKNKMDLYTELLTYLNSSELDFDQDDKNFQVMVQSLYDCDKVVTMEIYKDVFLGGYITYNDYDNSAEYSNVGCPEFVDVEDAVEWLVSA